LLSEKLQATYEFSAITVGVRLRVDILPREEPNIYTAETCSVNIATSIGRNAVLSPQLEFVTLNSKKHRDL